MPEVDARKLLAQAKDLAARYAGRPGPAPPTARGARLPRGPAQLRALTGGLLTLAPPWRALRWVFLAANPAALAVFLVAQQAPLPSPAPAPTPSSPAHAQARPL